jgi:hypothetical protein
MEAMPEALKCPSCAAPLEPPAPGATSARCPYCGCNVQFRDSGESIIVVTADAPPNHQIWVVPIVFLIAIVTGLVISFFFIESDRPEKPTTLPAWTPPATLPDIDAAPSQSTTFAKEVMSFGSQGIGAGQFSDARSIGVDGKGNIYVGENDGRVQVFDGQGKFLAEWAVAAKPLLSLSVNRSGVVYIAEGPSLMWYDGATGRPLGKAQSDEPGTYPFQDAFVTPSGDIYAVNGRTTITVLDSDGRIKNVFDEGKSVGDDVMFSRVVSSPSGEIFVLANLTGIFKFSADGRYINRFGNVDMTGDSGIPSQLHGPLYLAVDGQGRLYVSQLGPAVKVFNGNGNYLDSFGGNTEAFGIAIDNANEIFLCSPLDYTVRKFVPIKP